MELVLFLLLAISLPSNSDAESYFFNPIQYLRFNSDASNLHPGGLDCLSWRLAVETNNRRGWSLVPQSCKYYIEQYMRKGQYRRDCEEMAADAIAYAKSFRLAGDGKDVWVFDIDETTLSNLPYYARPDVQYGTVPRSRETFYEWVNKGTAPAVPGMLHLYNTVLSLGFKTIFLTASSDRYQEIRAKNLKKAGYDDWTRLIFRAANEGGMSYKSTKRTELVKEGFRIVGNVGDQWSDLLGPSGGNRTFKVPNPMYYV